jgi:chemotaxis protein methyltransferase CheR
MIPLQINDGLSVRKAPVFADLKSYLIGLTGLEYYDDKEDTLADRVYRRVVERRFANLEQYFAYLKSPDGRQELDVLIEELAIGETYFFRDTAQFEALNSVILPERFDARKNDRALRIWSAGCSSGAETYSIAILLERDWQKYRKTWNIELTGSDLCERRIARACSAEFSDWDLRSVPEHVKAECFDAVGKNWRLHERFRKGVNFEQRNLLDLLNGNRNDGGYDIILCRNVLIYFDLDLIRQLLAKFRSLLREGGWLLVGHSEPFLEIANFFAPVALAGATAYRRLDGAASSLCGALADQGPPDNGTALQAPVTATWDFPQRDAAFAPQLDPAPWLQAEPDRDRQMQTAMAYAQPSPIATADTAYVAPVVEEAETADPEALLSVARQCADDGRWREARDACEAYIEDVPLDPEGHFVLALILEHCNAAEGALHELRQCLYLDRQFALAHFHLGRLQALAGDRRRALRSYSNVIDLLTSARGDAPVRGGDGLQADELENLARDQVGRLVG